MCSLLNYKSWLHAVKRLETGSQGLLRTVKFGKWNKESFGFNHERKPEKKSKMVSI